MRSLFVIGDSISIQYGPYLKQMIAGRFHYDRKRGEEQALIDLNNPVGANGGDSGMVLQYLREEQSKGIKYDILLINCGLHDIKTDPATGDKQVELAKYRDNLSQIAGIAQEMARSFIWIRTTDALEEIHNSRCPGIHRFHEDVVSYNAAADEIMSSSAVPSIDLYQFTQVFGEAAYCDHVHFNEEVRQQQAAYIAGYLSHY
ncbi:SGNH/GDSL hydrolase family protein [Paenibacillus sp. IITD108]|uniref:SGNH/GDSL hydrolase family protein n=1 Tax=Paenibacillus sp. IITD108 TaxID=3116649 RepID=UPI002F3F5C3C